MFRAMVLVVLLAFGVFAPRGGLWLTGVAGLVATPTAECRTTSEEENTALVRAWYAAISAGDVEALEEFLAPEVVRHGGGTIADALGPEDIKRNFALYFAAFPDLQSDIQQVLADGNLVAVHAIEHGTHQGDLLGIPASGNEATWDMFAIYRIECGKIAEYWSQVDDLSRLQQLGVIPEVIAPAPATPAAATPRAGQS
jgi:steroid delta-isomerase-like uncharacterized protein